MKKNSKKYGWYFLTAIILLFFLHYLNILSPLENTLTKLVNPIWDITYNAKLIALTPVKYFQLQKNLIAENQGLKNENVSLKNSLATANELKLENDSLKKSLNYIETSKQNKELAKIIGQSPESSSIVIINRGRNSGLFEGLPVIAGEGVLIGKIIKANDNISLVRLLNDNASQVAGTFQNVDRTSGVIGGNYDLAIVMRQIPQDQKVQAGDLAITSGMEEKIPKGLLIGQVDHITKKAGDFFQEAVLKKIIEYNDLVWVVVLKP